MYSNRVRHVATQLFQSHLDLALTQPPLRSQQPAALPWACVLSGSVLPGVASRMESSV